MITITTQPTNNGKYTAYLPITIKATKTGNPAYLYFILRNASGTAISGMPTYKAPNINNEFTFDASSYLKNYFNVRTLQGLNSTTIEELTNIYGKFEVVINTIDSVTAGTTSNEFYGFAWIDNCINIGSVTSAQTADFGINKKGLLFSNDLKGVTTLDNFPNKRKKNDENVSTFVRKALFIDTYSTPNPNNSSTILETAQIDMTSYVGKLISIPLNDAFIQANFLVGGTTPLAAYQGFRLRDDDNDTCVYYHNKQVCNEQTFLYINRYGCKEYIYFKTTENENFSSKGQEFKINGFNYQRDGLSSFFGVEAPSMKINQENKTEFDVKGQYFRLEEKEALKDFFASPFHITEVNGKPYYINVVDGTFKISQDSRGLFVNFKYRLSQDKLAFV